jgi:hypothetical protein
MKSFIDIGAFLVGYVGVHSHVNTIFRIILVKKNHKNDDPKNQSFHIFDKERCPQETILERLQLYN